MFLGQAGGWVRDSVEARDFRRVTDAMAYCDTEHLVSVRIAIISDDPEETVYISPESHRREISIARKLRKRNRALREKQQMRVLQGQIVQQSLTLPMPHRESPPPEDGPATDISAA